MDDFEIDATAGSILVAAESIAAVADRSLDVLAEAALLAGAARGTPS